MQMIVRTIHSVSSTISHGVTPDLVASGQVLTGLGLLVVGAAGAAIARRQAQTARSKLQLDLYERRHPIFVATREFLALLTAKGTPSRQDLNAYMLATAEVDFLYGREVIVYVARFVEIAEQRILYSGPSANWPDSGDYAANLAWASSQYLRLTETFAPYLRLDERFVKLRPLATIGR